MVDERTLVVSISQSGETMDTLMAVKHARELGAQTISICNTHGSTIPRESDAVLYTHAGPEIAVASTKAFLAQITACYVLGLYLAQLRGGTYADEAQAVMKDLHEIPAKLADACWATSTGSARSPGSWPTPARCSSSAATSATRSPWRARSSSRSSPTSTPRASPPASSSTARSR